MAPSIKRLIVVVGNCQSNLVANFLRLLPEVSEGFEVRRFRNYDVDLDGNRGNPTEAPKALPEFLKSNKDRVIAVIQQSSHDWAGDSLDRDSFGPDVDFVDYPAAALSYLWPFAALDPRLAKLSAAARLSFPYTICDRLLTRLAERGSTEEDIVQAYMSVDIRKMVNLDRLRTISVERMKQLDAKSSFAINDWIESRVETEQMYRTMNHPGGQLMAHIIGGIVERLRFVEDRQVVEHHLEQVADGPGVQKVEAPIHPQIVEHFGLGWAKRNRYHFWNEGEYSFEEHILRLFQGRKSTTFDRADRAFRSGDLRTGIELGRAAVEEVPRSAEYRARLGYMLLKTGQTTEALQFFREAYELEPSGKAGHQLLRTQLRLKAVDAARTLLADLIERFGPEQSEVVLCRAEIELRTRGREVALGFLEGAAQRSADHKLWAALSDSRLSGGRDVAAREALDRACYLSGWSPALDKRRGLLDERIRERNHRAGVRVGAIRE